MAAVKRVSMPTYEYVCTSCSTPLEVVQSIHEPSLTDCPSCADGRLRKVFGNVGVVFKGSGFYRTDSRGKTSATSPAAPGRSRRRRPRPAARRPRRAGPPSRRPARVPGRPRVPRPGRAPIQLGSSKSSPRSVLTYRSARWATRVGQSYAPGRRERGVHQLIMGLARHGSDRQQLPRLARPPRRASRRTASDQSTGRHPPR